MYLDHFGLDEYPFGITPDTSFFFSSASSQQALNTLLVAARGGEGFVKITGEVGTGKTLLCRELLRCVAEEFETAYLPNPFLTPQGVLEALAQELGVHVGPRGLTGPVPQQHTLLEALNHYLLDAARHGRRVLVCLDEVQAMPVETLETLRLLTNLETEKRKLLQVVIFGQPELDAKLDHPSIRQLKQRITFDYHLGPLTGRELSRYLDHRMMIAGYRGAPAFSGAAKRLLRWRTRGVPRLVNIVAHKALMSAYGAGRTSVGWRDVLVAADDTASVRRRGPVLALASLALMGVGALVAQLARTL